MNGNLAFDLGLGRQQVHDQVESRASGKAVDCAKTQKRGCEVLVGHGLQSALSGELGFAIE